MGSNNKSAMAQRRKFSVSGGTMPTTARPTTALPAHIAGGTSSSTTVPVVNRFFMTEPAPLIRAHSNPDGESPQIAKLIDIIRSTHYHGTVVSQRFSDLALRVSQRRPGRLSGVLSFGAFALPDFRLISRVEHTSAPTIGARRLALVD